LKQEIKGKYYSIKDNNIKINPINVQYTPNIIPTFCKGDIEDSAIDFVTPQIKIHIAPVITHEFPTSLSLV
jgi:hypothetical protein